MKTKPTNKTPFKKKKKARILCCVFKMWVSIVSEMMFQLSMIYFLLLRTFLFHDCCAISSNCILMIFQPGFWACGSVATSHPWCEVQCEAMQHVLVGHWDLFSASNAGLEKGICEMKFKRAVFIHKAITSFKEGIYRHFSPCFLSTFFTWRS